jgi:hypothetical protein
MRQSVARAHDWEALVSKIAHVIADRVGVQLPDLAVLQPDL